MKKRAILKAGHKSLHALGGLSLPIGMTIAAFTALIVAISLQPAQAQSNHGWDLCRQSQGRAPGCSSTSSRGGTHQAPPRVPTAAELAAQKANELNQDGIAAFSIRDFARAELLFEQALQVYPNSPVIADNLAQARARRQAQREEMARQVAMNQSLTELSGALSDSRAAPAVKGLDFGGAGTSAKGLAFSGGSANSKGNTGCGTSLEFVNPNVVDARCVPTGLPNSVVAEIPNTPAGVRVRRGFEAIMAHDWNLARAYFKDALNHDPGNAGLMRLVDLAEYTLQRQSRLSPASHGNSVTPARVRDARGTETTNNAQDAARTATLNWRIDDKMNADLVRAMDDFNRNYLPKHPELAIPPPAKVTANWRAFFRDVFTPVKRQRNTYSVTAVRD